MTHFLKNLLNMSNTENYTNIPDEFICPMTLEIMNDPVITNDAITYERSYIEEWFKNNNTSPKTNLQLSSKELISNLSLKNAIYTWKQNQLNNVKVSSEHVNSKEAEKMSQNFNPFNIKGTVIKSITTNSNDNEYQLFINLISPDENSISRPNIDFIATVDVSGSMGINAEIPKTDGKNESSNLQILDITKHGIKTCLEVLSDNDRFALVTYSNKANTILPLTFMNEEGKTKAILAIENMNASGGTNIWDGIFKSLELVKNRSDKSRLPCISLLTDGESNYKPPRGEVAMFQRYIDANPEINNCIFNTYGFGYNLDSKLLFNLSNELNGMYSFIPDAGMVGTIFINSISNMLTTIGNSCQISIEINNDIKINEIFGFDKNYNKTSWGMIIDVGSLQIGQNKTFIINFIDENNDIEKNIDINLNLKYVFNKEINDKNSVKFSSDLNDEFIQEFCRLKVCHFLIPICLGEIKLQYKVLYNELVNQLKDIGCHKDLLTDVTGQINMGLLDNNHYIKWGKHFIPSLLKAHLLQQCLNFKDPGVQKYGGKLFNSIRDKADEAFNKLPPPKPKYKSAYEPVVSMVTYNNQYGGCFDGLGKVLLPDNKLIKVKHLKKGDKVLSLFNKVAEVVCIVRTKIFNSINLVDFHGVKLTPWHPIFVNDKWQFPIKLNISKEYDFKFENNEDKYIYNAVLDNGHALIINGVKCVTLAHNFIDNDVIKHPYFGTNLIIDDLKRKYLNQWNDGLITFSKNPYIRNENTNLVCGLISN
jgi:hypothetical protein